VSDEPPEASTVPLSPMQRARVDFAAADFQRVRALDLAAMDDAQLILLVERLRRRLDDVLDVLDEVSGTDPAGQQ